MKELILDLQKVSKERNRKQVLSDFYLQLYSGEIVNLIGLEGSGHEELWSLFSSTEEIDSGKIYYLGRQMKSFHELPVERPGGIFYIGNDKLLIPDLTVAENLYVIEKLKYRSLFVPRRKMEKQAEALFETFGIRIDPGRKAKELNKYESAMLRLMRAYIKEAKVIVVDDLIDDRYVNRLEEFGHLLERLKAEQTAILWLNRYPDYITEIADRIEIIREGRNAYGFSHSQYDQDSVLRCIVGEDFFPQKVHNEPVTDEIQAEFINLSGREFTDLSFSCKKGEIVGLYDLHNSINRELYNMIIGKAEFKGICRLKNRQVRFGKEGLLMQQGIVVLDGKHYQDMILQDSSLEENIAIAAWKKSAIGGVVLNDRILEHMKKVSDTAALRYGLPEDMSTVNRQEAVRIVFQRVLLAKPKLIICFQPFLRLDALSRNFLTDYFSEYCSEGGSVILGSANIRDLQSVCDRILVIQGAAFIRELKRGAEY